MGVQVVGDVEAPRLRRDLVGMAIDGLLVERVHDSRLRPSSRCPNVLRHLLERGLGPTGQEHDCALASKGTRDRAADRPTAPIDHSCLSFEQHVCLLNFGSPCRPGRGPKLIGPGLQLPLAPARSRCCSGCSWSAARLGKGAPRVDAGVTPALRRITDPKGHDSRTTNRPPGTNLKA